MPALDSIPIIGQQIGVDGYTIAISARCQCTAQGTFVSMTVNCSLAGVAISAGVCPRCKLGYTVQGMDLDNQARLTFRIAAFSAKSPDES